ncbi:uncharacterized protein LOC144637595 [Oculina patagonica]
MFFICQPITLQVTTLDKSLIWHNMSDVGEGHKFASGGGVYCFIRDLIVEGKDAWFEDESTGHFAINWLTAPMRYHTEFKLRTDKISDKKAGNNLRSALLNSYEKEGAMEYFAYQKRNDKREIFERHFQMPHRILTSLFGSVLLTDKGSKQEIEDTVVSEACKNSQESSSSSDTGFEEVMDISSDGNIPTDESTNDSLLDNTRSDEDITSSFEGCKNSPEPSSSNDTGFEEVMDISSDGDIPTQLSDDSLLDNTRSDDCPDPSCITSPFEMFGIPKEELKETTDKIFSYNDQQGVVQGIFPSAGSVKGGLPFVITLQPPETLCEDDSSRKYVAEFVGISVVDLEKENSPSNSSLLGIIPAAQKPGPVNVMVRTPAGQLLGITSFIYVDHETQDVLQQLVHNPALQTLFFTLWCRHNNIEQNQGPFIMRDQGSSVQTKQAEGLKVLYLLLLTAAQTNARQFIQMIFSTSAGETFDNTYKNGTQLLQDVARANGHDNLARYIQDVSRGLSKEGSGDAQSNMIDWLELVVAVNKIQNQSSLTRNETDLESGETEDEDKESDYFADAERSSCGSLELDVGWSDSKDEEDPCLKDGTPKGKLSEKSHSSLEEGASLEIPDAVFPPEAEIQIGSVVIEKDYEEENSEEPSTANSKPSMNLSNGFDLLAGLGTEWRSGDATTARNQRACGSFELDVGLSDSEDDEEPGFKDGGLKKEIRKRSSLFLQECSSFEMALEILENVVEKKNDDDENNEEPYSVNSKPGLVLDGLVNWLSTSQVVDTTTSRQQKTCVDETQEMQLFTDSDDYDGTYPDNGGSKKELNGRSTASIDDISSKIAVADLDNTTARDEGAVGGGTQKSYDTSIRQQEANAYPSHEETATTKSPFLACFPTLRRHLQSSPSASSVSFWGEMWQILGIGRSLQQVEVHLRIIQQILAEERFKERRRLLERLYGYDLEAAKEIEKKRERRRLQSQAQNLHKSHVIFEGECLCGENYVGETMRNLEVRITEHSNICHTSETARHLLENPSHSFQWKVLCSARSYFKRKIIEGLIIQQKSPTLNKQVNGYVVQLFPSGIA